MNELSGSVPDSQENTISVSKLIETDIKTTRHESEYLKEMLTSYFRQSLSYPLEFYKNYEAQPLEIRIELRNDPFRKKVGPYIHVLDFSETERVKFAQDGECNELVVFLLFERDLDVLDAVFNNPRLPTKNLLDFINLIKERDIDREDDKILKIAQLILRRRTQRIAKARDIQINSQEPLNQNKLINLFTHLWDDDPLIRQASGNVLSIVDWRSLKELLLIPDLIIKIREQAPKIPGTEIIPLFDLTLRLMLKNQKKYKLLFLLLLDRLHHIEIRLLMMKQMKKKKRDTLLLLFYIMYPETKISH